MTQTATEYLPHGLGPMPVLLTIEEAAHALRLAEDREIALAERSVHRLVDQGKLRAVVIGRYRRIPKDEILRFVRHELESSTPRDQRLNGFHE